MAQGVYVGVDNKARKVNKIYVGVDNKARLVTKAYVGVGGKARLFWSMGAVEYYGTATPLSQARNVLAAATVGNYALFGGGYGRTGTSAVVDAYDISLTMSTPSRLSRYIPNLAATSIGNYVLFGGGYNPIMDAYDTSLTRSSLSYPERSENLAATTVGNYAIFGGGKNATKCIDTTVAYNASLTQCNIDDLSLARCKLAATTVGTYAIFGGGASTIDENVLESIAETYNTSLTRGTAPHLWPRCSLTATTVGGYALFGGGGSGNISENTVVAYDISLTRSKPMVLSVKRYDLASTATNKYAIFSGGIGTDIVDTGIVDVYDTFLTRSTSTALSTARGKLAATTIGDYALFGGGSSNNSSSPTYSAVVDVYK